MVTPGKHIENTFGTWYCKGTMNKENAVKYAYAAGFVDGEGCLKMSKRNPRNGRAVNYGILVSVVQKDARPLDWLVGNFGGMIYLKNKKLDSSDWIYEWRVSEQRAYEFLKKISPFLKVKREQADLLVRFQERRIFERKRNNPDNGRFAPLTPHEIEVREELYKEVSRLKRQYAKSKNPSVVEYNFKSMVQP